MFKKIAVLGTVVVGVGVLATAAFAGGGLLTFEDNGAVVTPGQHKSARIVVGAGQDGGVYRNITPAKNLKGVNLSFVSFGDVQGGGPRWSIPVDTNHDRSTVEGYAFIDAAGCGAVNGDNPTGIETLVSTKSASCKVFYSGDGIQYANWKTFAAAYPKGKLAEAVSFVIADVPGDYSVDHVTYGS